MPGLIRGVARTAVVAGTATTPSRRSLRSSRLVIRSHGGIGRPGSTNSS